MQHLILADVLACTDALFIPCRKSAVAQKAADRARVTYGRWGLRWSRPQGEGTLAACRELQRRGLLVRSPRRALLTEKGDAYARCTVGVPQLLEAWPVLQRLGDWYQSETKLIDGPLTWTELYKLEHVLLPAIISGLAWSRPEGNDLVAYKLSPLGADALLSEMPVPAPGRIDREASEHYQERFLSLT